MYLLALEDISRDLGVFSFSSRWEGGEKGGLILRFTMIFLYRDLVDTLGKARIAYPFINLHY